MIFLPSIQCLVKQTTNYYENQFRKTDVLFSEDLRQNVLMLACLRERVRKSRQKFFEVFNLKFLILPFALLYNDFEYTQWSYLISD